MHLVSLVSASLAASALTCLVSASYGDSGSGQQGSCYASPGSVINVLFPLYFDYFPYTTPGSKNDTDIAVRAHGIPPDILIPKSVSQDTLTSLKVSAANGFYAVAFLVQLLTYIFNEKPGYYIADSAQRAYVTAALEVILAQEEQHAFGANNLLPVYGVEPLQPCKYIWPAFIKDFNTAIFAADFLAEINAGVLQRIIEQLAQNGDSDFIRVFASYTQNEAEQAGWFRSLNGKIASTNPFPATLTRRLFYSHYVQYGFVPGSCPSTNFIDLQVYEPLTLVQPPTTCTDVDQRIELSIRGSNLNDIAGYSVEFINQQNNPIVVPIEKPQSEGGCINFYAVFPCSLVLFGASLTVISVVNNTGPFINIEDLSDHTVYGPTFAYPN